MPLRMTSLALAASAVLVAGCANNMATPRVPAAMAVNANPTVGGAAMFANRNIIENAVDSPIHTTLVAAVKAAGLVDTLSGPGPFTVFAPTDAAFAALPAGTVETLLLPENKAKLTEILTYHVVPTNALSGAIAGMIADDKGAHPVKTVSGGVLIARSAGDSITLTDEQGRVSTVTIADVVQSNGVIHVVDTVLLPAERMAVAPAPAYTTTYVAPQPALAPAPVAAPQPVYTMQSSPAPVAAQPVMMASESNNPMVGGAPMFANKNIIENAVESADHTTLVAAVKAAGLVDTLSGPGPFTVFAPTNAAFEKLPAGTVETLLKPENKAMLAKILTYHVVPTAAMSTDISKMIADDGGAHLVRTVAGNVLLVRQGPGGTISLSDEKGGVSNVTIADVKQSNGVIHVIDTVLLPAE